MHDEKSQYHHLEPDRAAVFGGGYGEIRLGFDFWLFGRFRQFEGCPDVTEFHLGIARSISGIGFQPVKPKMTG